MALKFGIQVGKVGDKSSEVGQHVVADIRMSLKVGLQVGKVRRNVDRSRSAGLGGG